MTASIDTATGDRALRVRELLDDVLAGSPVFPVEIVVRGRTGSHVVEVYVDSPDDLGANDLAAISRELGALLEQADIIRGAYRLNVSTPGADRPLVDPRQYAKHVGRRVRLGLGTDSEDDAGITGTLRGLESDEVVLSDDDGSVRRVPVDSIREARVLLPW